MVVGGEMVAGVEHGFDKKPGKYPRERDLMYSRAVEQIRTMV